MSACTIFRGLTLFSRFGNGDYLNRVSLRSSEDASPLLPHLGVNSPTLCIALYLVSFRVLPIKKVQSMSACTISEASPFSPGLVTETTSIECPLGRPKMHHHYYRTSG